jgi:hypothetical protein
MEQYINTDEILNRNMLFALWQIMQQCESEKLKMYLRGIGETGKSQVIKALVYFFTQWNEEHILFILAQTGSAATLLNESTYHSVLGINGRSDIGSAKKLMQIHSQLEGVDYIFLDEVSMLSCHNLFKISAQLAKGTNDHEEPFGGMNVIFVSDFAQLKPVKCASLYSGSVGTELQSRMSAKKQEETIGKTLWDQITTVVILQENMRQITQTPDDEKFCTALENMKYKVCTTEDVHFFCMRTASDQPDRPKLTQKQFHNISIITAWNPHEDQINKLGSERFENKTGQTLTTFYSKYQWAEHDEAKKAEEMDQTKNRNPKQK